MSGLTSLNTRTIYMYVIRIAVQAVDWVLSTFQGDNHTNPVEHSNVNEVYGLVRALLSNGLLNRVLKQ